MQLLEGQNDELRRTVLRLETELASQAAQHRTEVEGLRQLAQATAAEGPRGHPAGDAHAGETALKAHVQHLEDALRRSDMRHAAIIEVGF